MAKPPSQTPKKPPAISSQARASVIDSLVARLRSANGTAEKEAVRAEIHRRLAEFDRAIFAQVKIERGSRQLSSSK